METLVIDIGGRNVKVWRTGESDKVKIPSGKGLTPETFMKRVRREIHDVEFDRVSIGYPGNVVNGRPVAEPINLGPGWTDYDFADAFGCPLRIMNDACMQALGSYEGGRMLYLGLGTGIGTTFISDGKIIPLALGHLRFLRSETFDEALSRRGLELHGQKRWARAVSRAAELLRPAFEADYVMLGGGNAKKLRTMPPECRRGSNHNAYFGGVRMWEDSDHLDFPSLTLLHPEDEKATTA